MIGQEARDNEREALAQLIANAFFSMEAGQEWDAEGSSSYEQPVPSAGDMYLAASIVAAGYWKHPEPEITEAAIIDRFSSLSNYSLARIANAAERVIDGRNQDGVFS